MDKPLTFQQVKQPDPPRWPDETGRHAIFISDVGNWHVSWDGWDFVTTYKLSGAIRAANVHEAAVWRIEQAMADGTPLRPPATKYRGRNTLEGGNP